MTQSEKEHSLYSSEKPVQNDHNPFGNNISTDTGQWEILWFFTGNDWTDLEEEKLWMCMIDMKTKPDD